MNQDIGKRAAGYAAAELIKEGMLVGLGTGSTVAYFIEKLAEKCRQGLKLKGAVASSEKSYNLGQSLGIPMINADEILSLDITVDGADEIDPEKRMIKGGGGALLREKILASMSREMVIIIDASKEVKQLGTMPLPVEIVTFAYKSIIKKIEELGYKVSLRKTADGKIYLTDNQNYIADISSKPCKNPEKEDTKIKNIPGVVETGFFFNLANTVIIGYSDGHIEFRS